jgi:hypothetical protein
MGVICRILRRGLRDQIKDETFSVFAITFLFMLMVLFFANIS